MFINTLPLRVRLVRHSALECLQQTHAALAALLHHEHASLALAQRCSGLPGGTPLFATLLNYRYGQSPEAEGESADWPGMTLLSDEERTNYPITLSIDDRGVAFELVFQTDAEIDAQRLQAYLLYALRGLLSGLVAHSPRPLLEVELLDLQERLELQRYGVNATVYADLPALPVMFEQQVQRTPQSIALVFESREHSYAQLNEQANRLAHRLRAHAVGAESRVGVCLERSVEMVVALLAVLKAGAAYVPLDPQLPEARLRLMIEDSAVALLLAHSEVQLESSTVPRWSLDGLSLQAESSADPGCTMHPEQLAYVIYTSGSTGRPKAVMVRHGALSHFLRSMQQTPGLSARDVLVAVTSLSFDIAALELYLPLISGARVVLANREQAREGVLLAQLIENSAATVLQSTPAGWRMLRAAGWPHGPVTGLKALCGGEALQPDLAQDLTGLGIELWNMYGPTETTIWSAALAVAERVAVGGAIAGTQLQVLDGELRAVPRGVVGELYLGGVGLARGYLSKAGLTAERFIANPLSTVGERLYRTGDLVRWRADGRLDYLGRIDHQVKLRGYRIELGEIEAQLLAQGEVREAVVVAQAEQLIAYVSGRDIQVSELREALGQSLPQYMVPALIVEVERLPLNASGKVDRKALPTAQSLARGYEPPQGELEQALAQLWSEVLGVERIGRHDNFFELGAHSLLAARLLARVRSVLAIDLPLRAVFEHPTLHALAARLPMSEQSHSRVPLRDCSPADLPSAVAAHAETPFDLASGPVLRAALLRLAPQRHVLLLCVHHIAFDGWSEGVFTRELVALYRAFKEGGLPALPPLSVQYADYAHWHLQSLRQSAVRDAGFWQKYLQAAPALSTLPPDRPRLPDNAGAVHDEHLPHELALQLTELARAEHTSLFTVLLSAFLLVLHRRSNSADLVVGTDVVGRSHPSLEELIGFFVNVVPVRSRLEPAASFRQWLTRTRESVLDVLEHQHAPLDQIIEWAAAARQRGVSPLVQVLFVMQNLPAGRFELPGLCIGVLPRESAHSKFDLAVFVSEGADGLHARWLFASQWLTRATIERSATAWSDVLRRAAVKPETPLQELLPVPENPTASLKISKLDKLKRIQSGAARSALSEPITAAQLSPERVLPLVIQPTRVELDPLQWAREQRAFIESVLCKHGAILFRNFAMRTPQQFEAFAEALEPQLYGSYGDLPKKEGGRNIYRSTPYPERQMILYHNESSHLERWPRKQLFFCELPAPVGGATPIVDCREVLRRLPVPLIEQFECKQLLYVRTFTRRLDVCWQEFFKTESRTDVEARLAQAGSEWQWLDEDTLQTRTRCPAVIRHPLTGERVFFNQVQLHHVHCLDADVRRDLLAMVGLARMPRHVRAQPVGSPGAVMVSCEPLLDAIALALSPEQQVVLCGKSAGAGKLIAWIEVDAAQSVRLPEALARVCAAHQVLRHAFLRDQYSRALTQYCFPDAAALTLQSFELPTDQAQFDHWCAEPLRLEQRQIVRAALVRSAEHGGRLVLAVSELVVDDWSLATLIQQIATASATSDSAETEPIFQYAQYIEWRQVLASAAEAEQGRAYWREYLRDALELSAPRLAVDRQGRIGRVRHSCCIEPAHRSASLELARQFVVTSEMLLQAVWHLLLARLTHFTRAIAGWRHDCRSDYEPMQGAVGVFGKTLPFIVDAVAEETCEDWIARHCAFARAHLDAQEYWDLVDPLTRAHCVVGFSYSEQALPHRQLEILDAPASFELSLHATLTPEGGWLTVDADAACYSEAAARRMLDQFTTLLVSVLQNPSARIADSNLLSSAELTVLLQEPTAVDFGAEPLTERIRHWAHVTPQALAIEHGETCVSYQELAARANRMARWLQSQGIGRGALVALNLPRSPQWLIAMLAVWQAGAGYVPLEPQWPAGRQESVLLDAEPELVLHADSSSFCENVRCRQVAWSDIDTSAAADEPLVPSGTLQDIAYVLYTSGSTGKPKGAVIEHGALLNYVAAVSITLNLARARRWALTSSVAADLGNTALFGALFNGACVVIAEPEQSHDAQAFAQFMRAKRIDGLKIVPSHLEALLECSAPCLPQTLVLGGEAAARSLIQRIRQLAPECSLYNHYGPTETTVGVMVHAVDVDSQTEVLPLSQVLANNRVRVLDASLQLVPSGARGEVCIGGAQLCRGYLKQAAPRAFIEDPLRPGELLYRTGDLAYVRAEGGLQLAGRIDHQVKVRGFRIEPAEIEAALLGCAGVRQTVVIANSDDERGVELVACVVADTAENEWQARLVSQLARQLPSYMLPARYVRFTEFPRLANGKIDRQALIAAPARSATRSRTAPRTPVEAALAACMAEILGCDSVGVDEDFFALGGQSLLAIKLAARIGRSLEVEVEPGLVIDCPTVEKLAERLGERVRATVQSVQLAQGGSGMPLYCLPGTFGNGSEFAPLAAAMRGERPVVAFVCHTLGPDRWRRHAIEDLAADYARFIESHCVAQQCALLGWSFGGDLAHETARQLQGRVAVKFLGVVDVSDRTEASAERESANVSVPERVVRWLEGSSMREHWQQLLDGMSLPERQATFDFLATRNEPLPQDGSGFDSGEYELWVLVQVSWMRRRYFGTNRQRLEIPLHSWTAAATAEDARRRMRQWETLADVRLQHEIAGATHYSILGHGDLVAALRGALGALDLVHDL
jgi:amino acid adenylation domain-containing protein